MENLTTNEATMGALTAQPRILKILWRIQFASILGYVVFLNFSISLTQISQAIGIIAWLTSAHLTQSWKEIKLPLAIPFILYSVACVASTITAMNPLASLSDLKMVLRMLTFFWIINCLGKTNPKEFLLWLATVIKIEKWKNKTLNYANSFSRKNVILFFTTLLFLSCTASMLYALFHAFLHRPGSGLTSQYEVWVKYWNIWWPRIHGTQKHVFTFSGILMMIGVLGLSRLLFDKFKKWLLWFFILMLICLGLTLTRHVWLGFFVAACILFFFRKPILVVVPPLILLAVYYLSPMLNSGKDYSMIGKRLESMVTLEDFSSSQRILIWKDGWDIVKTYPFTGCGLSCLHSNKEYFQKYETLKKYLDMHNNVMQVLVFNGFLGLLPWLSIWFGYFFALFKKWKELRTDPIMRWIVLGSFGAVVSFLIAGNFAANFFDSKVVLVLYFIMALPFVNDPPPNASKQTTSAA